MGIRLSLSGNGNKKEIRTCNGGKRGDREIQGLGLRSGYWRGPVFVTLVEIQALVVALQLCYCFVTTLVVDL